MQETKTIYIQAESQQGSFLASNETQIKALTVNPQVPNPLERELASPKIGPFGWIGIAFCIILVVLTAVSIFNAVQKNKKAES